MSLVRISDLMQQTGVKFGTSGARGLAVELTDRVAYAYTRGFLAYLKQVGELRSPQSAVAVAGDYRPSTGRIMEAVLRAAEDLGCTPVNCGRIPSPAVALYGLVNGIPSIMVTGSHIPDDRNGIKFNKCSGEVLKEDETGITSQEIEIPDGLFGDQGAFDRPATGPRDTDDAALDAYVRRYPDFLPGDCLRGVRLGVYQHSSVGRDVLVEVLGRLGAEVEPLGRSETFVPVDTEAIRDEDVQLARKWAAEGRFDAIVSADGDADRPLISDERGKWIRGDVAGILCARYLGADSVSTPVSSNSAVELCGWFDEVRRTKIGSPYVISSMCEASARGRKRVVGYEANGGFLLNSDIVENGRRLRALPTRDALILILSLLLFARKEGIALSQLVASLPARFTASGLLKQTPPAISRAILGRYSIGDESIDRRAVEQDFGTELGSVARIDRTDGIRITFAGGEIVHLRPSGNAPEFRVYTESGSEEGACELNRKMIEKVRGLAGIEA